MIKKRIMIFFSLSFVMLLQCSSFGAKEPDFVVREGGKSFIVDQLGERWEVTQAESIGFKPGKFQYGIGRNAFITLDDSLLTGPGSRLPGGARVIGISEGTEAKAYSVSKLRGHEISNSELNGKPVAIGY